MSIVDELDAIGGELSEQYGEDPKQFFRDNFGDAEADELWSILDAHYGPLGGGLVLGGLSAGYVLGQRAAAEKTDAEEVSA